MTERGKKKKNKKVSSRPGEELKQRGLRGVKNSSLDSPDFSRPRKVSVRGNTPKSLKKAVQSVPKEAPFARECLDFVLRYQGKDEYVLELKERALSEANWLPEHSEIVTVSAIAAKEQKERTYANAEMRRRLMRLDDMDLPDSLDDPPGDE